VANGTAARDGTHHSRQLAVWSGHTYLAVWNGDAYTPGLYESALHPAKRSADDKPYASNLREAWWRSLQGLPLNKNNKRKTKQKRGESLHLFF